VRITEHWSSAKLVVISHEANGASFASAVRAPVLTVTLQTTHPLLFKIRPKVFEE
jgi:hypothetical protein